MIPKIIHYVWLGGNELPDDALKCIESWKKFCPDYQIKEWNEENFPIEEYTYAKEAYANKKWAFVSDVARLYALVTEGGIYMDTDVEVISSLDEFLTDKAFSGFESDMGVPTGLMACEAGHPFFKTLLEEYETAHFIRPDGSLDLTTNVTRITNACLREGLVLNNQKQTIAGFTLYPKDYFCPLSHENGKLEKTENTVAIHWFAGSWKSSEEKANHLKAMAIRKKLGIIGSPIAFAYEKAFKVTYILKTGSFSELFTRTKNYFNRGR